MTGKKNTNRASISAIYTHITYIREKIDTLDKKVDSHIEHFETCQNQHNKLIGSLQTRIQRLEDWRISEEQGVQRRLERHGLYIGILALIVSTILNLLALIMGK